ncbi:MAG: CRISPR-associated endonuclease Cas3'', partial [Gammaproteobacteria bacterium]|nr:CRISPR-associated endonuclease Cas3'' [Gammaproteobacteria bacterium]
MESYLKYWGKAIKDDEDQQGADYHLLVFHCLDVAAVADIWLQESNTILNQISSSLACSPDQAKKIVLFFVLLHDLGKFDARFQNFRKDIRQLLQGDKWVVYPDINYYSHGSCGY